MIWKKALKYPVLVVGIILFALYLNNPKTEAFWENYNRRFIPSTCDALKDRSSKKLPDGWTMKCPGTQLLKLTIEVELQEKNSKSLRALLYRDLANKLQQFASLTNLETLENLKDAEITLKHPRLEIIAKTDGLALVQLLKKKNQKEVAKHLQLTVKTREIKK